MRIIWLFLLVYNLSFAQSLVTIDSDEVSIENFEVEYFIDTTGELKFEDIASMNFKVGKSSDTLGAKVTNTWVKVKLFNTTNKTQNLFLHQDLGYTFLDIRYFEVDNQNNLLTTKELNIYADDVKDYMYGADSIFQFSIKPQEYKTIYINQTTPAYHFYSFSIFNEKNSNNYLVYQKVDGILFVGLLLALAIYNLFIYFSSRYKEYLYYSLYLFCATVWIFYMYGSLAHYFHIYGLIPFKFNFALMFIPIFLALFVQAVFDTKQYYKTEHKALNIMNVILLANFIYALIDFVQAIQLLSLVLNYTLVVFLWIGISIYRKKNKMIKLFLLAHIFYLIFNIYAILFYLGMVDYSYIAYHGVGIGIILEALMLSYLLSYKFKVMEDEKKESQLLLLQKTKMADMGEMIANIAHQWRQPLATISVSSGILRERKLLDKLSDKNFIDELDHIDSNLLHMSQTVEDFLTYFRPNKIKEDFYVKEAVDKALLIIGNTLYKSEIKTKIDINESDKIFGLKDEYVQVLISILSNAIHALATKEEKTIYIKSEKFNDQIVLSIEDNAGGIKEELLPKIFEPYITTKHQSVGTGLGLYISKNIIQNSMGGDISVKNTKNGAKFTIIT